MGVVTYSSLDGEIVSEVRDGVRRDYLPDPLGSTVALLDSSQTKTETASYWPYGEQRGTGMLSTPFGYVGTFGYYTDDADRVYVRARTLLAKKARWLTVDPLWPDESAYGYVGQSPTSWSDPSGTFTEWEKICLRAQMNPWYNPTYWNKPPQIDSNNCYSYACSRPGVVRHYNPQPGDYSGRNFDNFPGGMPSCSNIAANAKRDGSIKDAPTIGGCAAGWHKVCLYVTVGDELRDESGRPLRDYHWYRQDRSGYWSDKPGQTPITNVYPGANLPIASPDTDARMRHYSQKCGCFCSRNNMFI